MFQLVCIGDLLAADRFHTPGIGPGSMFKEKKGQNWFSFHKHVDQTKDLLFGNLEVPLVSQKLQTKLKKNEFAGNPDFANWLSRAGLDAVSVANNHILEFGEAGFRDTLQALEKAGVRPVGIADLSTGSNLALVQKGECTIGFAAFNAIHDIPNNNHYAGLSEESVKKAINSLNAQGADLICLSFHWGNEYVHIPSWEQVQLARKAIDYGAHLIIGHHPHVIQPIEQYKEGWIIYSLGNFIFDMSWSRKVRTGMCTVLEVDNSVILSCKPYAVDIQSDYRPVVKEDDHWFENILNNNSARMKKLLQKGEKTYKKKYGKLLKRNRRKARIGMKIQLARQWFSIPKDARKKIRRDLIGKVW